MLNGRQQNGGSGSINLQADNISYSPSYNSPPDFLSDCDFGILDEIFDYIFERIPEVDIQTINNRSSSTNIKKKIELNFRNENERTTIKETFHRNWIRKSLVEEFIARENEVNPMKVDALVDTVQSDFRKLKNSEYSRTEVESNKVIQELAISYLPENRKKNPEYVANAKAIILYLFELCYFGKVTDEQQKTFEDYLNSPGL